VKQRKSGSKYTIRYYHCGNWRNKGPAVCSVNGIRADYADEYVFSRLAKVICNEKVLKDIVKSLNIKRKNKVKPLEDELKYMEKRISELSVNRDKYLNLFEENVLDATALKKRMASLEGDMKKYADRREDILREIEDNDSQPIPYELVHAVLTDLHKNLDKADDSIKKMLLQLIVRKITITDRKKIDTIELHFDEKIITHFLTNDKEHPSPDGGSSHVQTYKSLQLFVVRFTVSL